MSNDFDPYYEWLGIQPREQPVNYYRLLALNLYETSARVIANAADRQMTYIRSFQNGTHSRESQQLLNEIAQARVTLLNETKKREYDNNLKRQPFRGELRSVSPPVPISVQPEVVQTPRETRSAPPPLPSQPGPEQSKPEPPTMERLVEKYYYELKEKKETEEMEAKAKRLAQELFERDQGKQKKAAFQREKEEDCLAKIRCKWQNDGKSFLPGKRNTISIHGVEFAFRWCPPGMFIMGSPAQTWEDFFNFRFIGERGRFNDETQHVVTITNGFWILETPVTNVQWNVPQGDSPRVDHILRIMEEDDFIEADDIPVNLVNWNECHDFCKSFTDNIKAYGLSMTASLPSEAQWEYACRAGTTGPYAGELDRMAWYMQNSVAKVHSVGAKEPNAWGLYDMHGNVWEWCSDWYTPKIENDTGDYLSGPKTGCQRVIRGGGCRSIAEFCRSAQRNKTSPETANTGLGFRMVLNYSFPDSPPY